MSARPDSPFEAERLAGALDLLYDLRADLTLQYDEANSEAAREALDEVLNVLASLETEYQRRYKHTQPSRAGHASYLFLLGSEGSVHPLPHTLYVQLTKGEAAAPEFAARTMRVADWYVRLEAGSPVAVVNETAGLMSFDAEGRVEWQATPSFHPHRDNARLASESASLPSPEERERMRRVIFGEGAE